MSHQERKAPIPLQETDLTAIGLRPEQSAGLFVGSGKFQDAEVPDIAFAVDDAVDLAHCFVFELKLILPENVKLLLAGKPQKKISIERLAKLQSAGCGLQEATGTAVYRQAYSTGQMTGKDGIYVVTFASHGFCNSGRTFIAASDVWKLRRLQTSVELELMLADIRNATASRRLVLADVCQVHDDGRAMVTDFRKKVLKTFERQDGLASLIATIPGGCAFDDHQSQNGVFTSSILHALSGQAETVGSYYITLGDVARYTDTQVKGWVIDQKPEYRDTSYGILSRLEPVGVERLPLALSSKSQSDGWRPADRTELLRPNIDHHGWISRGVSVWNSWRAKNTQIMPILAGAQLDALDLSGVNFSGTNLTGANLSLTTLENADCSNAIMAGANLSNAVLKRTNLTRADLSRVDFAGAQFENTQLSGATLLAAKNLDLALHFSRSFVDLMMVRNSPGISHRFLRECGLGEHEIVEITMATMKPQSDPEGD